MARIHKPEESSMTLEARVEAVEAANEFVRKIMTWQNLSSNDGNSTLLDGELLSLVGQAFLQLTDKDPTRSGLAETPIRFASYWAELLEGQKHTNAEIATFFNKCFEDEGDHGKITTGLVVEKDIAVFSTCEHHIALMYDMKVTIAYLPAKKVIGLSKMGRIAEMCAKRLQLQEKIGEDISEVLRIILGTEDVAVLIEGKHACMTARGIKSREAITKTACLHGKFLDSATLRQELYAYIK